jgi:hypothetical protein
MASFTTDYFAPIVARARASGGEMLWPRKAAGARNMGGSLQPHAVAMAAQPTTFNFIARIEQSLAHKSA